MLTYTIAEYVAWRQGLVLMVPPPPQWEPADEVERLMRQKPWKGGALYSQG